MKTTEQITALGIIFGIVIIGFAGFLWLSPGAASGIPAAFTHDQLVRPDSAMTGAPTAKVTLVEWGDFQCPSCAAIEPVLSTIVDAYGKNPDFNFVFRHLPLPQHANARSAAEAAVAAGAQGRFWDFYSLLYRNQKEWTDSSNPLPLFVGYAKAIGLDATTFSTALTNHTYASLIAREYEDARTLGVSHTPALFLNGTELRDVTFGGISQAIDAALAQ